jgi:hypothetical protein
MLLFFCSFSLTLYYCSSFNPVEMALIYYGCLYAAVMNCLAKLSALCPTLQLSREVTRKNPGILSYTQYAEDYSTYLAASDYNHCVIVLH